MARIGERADARANRARILDAARQLLAERGIEWEMRELAERADVGMGTLYRNFATKDDLFAAIAGELLAEAVGVIDAALAEPDAAMGVERLLEGLFAMAEKGGAAVEALHRSAIAVIPEQFESMSRRIDLVFQRAVDAGVIRGGLDVALLTDCMKGLFSFYQVLRELHGPEVASRMAREVLLNGILAPDARARPAPGPHARPMATR
ncbi:MAG: helix-turn-helix transcriptional regulator [Chloroflexi bacterium]|nr:helix-turn-helix transcriptional regulator [Chloroflexota bacterium]